MVTFNLLLVGFLAVDFLQLIFSLWLEKVNRRHSERQGDHVPRLFEGFIDGQKLTRIVAYTREQSVRLLSANHLGPYPPSHSSSGFLPFLEDLAQRSGFPLILSGLFFLAVPRIYFIAMRSSL